MISFFINYLIFGINTVDGGFQFFSVLLVATRNAKANVIGNFFQ